MKNFKGIIIISLVILFVMGLSIYNEKHTKVYVANNIYIFYKENCPYCQKLHEYLNSLKEDTEYGKMFSVVDLEISDEDNYNLMNKVSDKLSTNITGVPFYVIGDTYISGFSEKKEETIKKAIKDAYYDLKYKDVVEEVQSGKDKDDSKISFVLIIILLFFSGLIIFASIRNKNTVENC